MKASIKFSILSLALVLSALALAIPLVSAQETPYTLLAPIPDYGIGETTSATPYIQGIFRMLIAIAGALAVIMIIWGGIQYMSTDALSGKSEAKNTISHAIWGLLLAISAWLILYTINPALTRFDLRLPPIETQPTAPAGTGGEGFTTGGEF